MELILALVLGIYWICRISADKSKSKAFDKKRAYEREDRERRMAVFENRVVDNELEDRLGVVARTISGHVCIPPEYEHYREELNAARRIYSLGNMVLTVEDIQRILLANRGKLRSMDIEFGITIRTAYTNYQTQTVREARSNYAKLISGLNTQLVKHGVYENMYLVGDGSPYKVQQWDGEDFYEPYGEPLWSKVKWAPSLYAFELERANSY